MRSRLGLTLLAVSLASCASTIRRYPLAEPMWVDAQDMRPYAPPPDEYFSGLAWDGVDNMFFRPMARFFAVDPAGEALNVNAMDEVPDSSWFRNRLSRRDMSIGEMLAGPCAESPPLDPHSPWMITRMKPDGATPGFIIRDQQGRHFVLKFDRLEQPERATGADAVGSIFYHSSGYYVPCNRMVFFNQEVLEVDPEGTATIAGVTQPLTLDLVAESFENMYRREDGKYRGLSSEFLAGRPIGPWRYERTRGDDPNDVVPHQERRELRGGRVLAAWLNHFDSREQNTLATWMEVRGEAGYIRHNYVDFGDCFGSLWPLERTSQRVSSGTSGYFYIPHVAADFITLGLLHRPYHNRELGPAGPALGYYNDDYFVPDDWRGGYQNPAFMRASESDNAWMARIIAMFDSEDIRAIVGEAHFENQTTHTELIRILLGRQRKILERYLTKLSPLTWPTVRPTEEGTDLCLKDLAVRSELLDWEARPYWARAWHHKGGDRLEEIAVGRKVRRRPDWICVDLPSVSTATADDPAYLIVDIAGLFSEDDEQARPARVHLYQLGGSDYRVVGLQRPSSLAPPSPRD